MAMAPKAYAVHHIRGRSRFRIPARRGDKAFFAELARRVARLPGVTRVDANPASASILIHHSADLDALLDEALGSDTAQLAEFVLSLPPVARRLHAEVAALDGIVRRWSAGGFDLGTVAAFGLVALAGLQLLRRQQSATAPAVSLAWYATELLRRSAEPAPHAAEPTRR